MSCRSPRSVRLIGLSLFLSSIVFFLLSNAMEARTRRRGREIDRLVYDLYGLTPGDIRLMEEEIAN